MKFYLKLFSFFLLFAGSYSILVSAVSPNRIPKQSWWQHNRMRAEAFLTEGKDARFVITGSSMSDRMIAEKNSGWFNLSLVGEGALTGLALLAASDAVPKYVLIEVNQLSVKENSKFALENTDPYFVFTRRNFPIFLTEKQPSNFFLGIASDFSQQFSFLQPANPSSDPSSEERARKLKEDHLEEVIRWYGAPVEFEKLEQRMQSLSRILTKLSEKGIRPIFYEIPMHPKVLSSPKETRTREIVRKRFPETGFLWYTAKGSPFEDSDALHLTYPEANRFFAELKEYAENLK